MSREDAEKELAALAPSVEAAWRACEAKRAERAAFEDAWAREMEALQNVWCPLYSREQKLKTFLEVA